MFTYYAYPSGWEPLSVQALPSPCSCLGFQQNLHDRETPLTDGVGGRHRRTDRPQTGSEKERQTEKQ